MVYRNKKTKELYFVACDDATHSETLERMVVYQNKGPVRKTWVRPYALFQEKFELVQAEEIE